MVRSARAHPVRRLSARGRTPGEPVDPEGHAGTPSRRCGDTLPARVQAPRTWPSSNGSCAGSSGRP